MWLYSEGFGCSVLDRFYDVGVNGGGYRLPSKRIDLLLFLDKDM